MTLAAMFRRLLGRGGPGGEQGPAEGSSAGPGVQTADAATETDRRMMGRAIELAREAAAKHEVPVGAVVYRTADGTILGEGYNLRETMRDPSAHAEFLAIVRACEAAGDWRLNDCTLVVTLEPCAMCAGLIVNARVGRLVYGATDPKAGAVGSLMNIAADPRLNHRAAIIAGVMASESSELLRGFFRSLRDKTAGDRRGPG